MKWLLPLLFLAGTAAAETLDISKFGGLNTDFSPATLPANETPDSENIVSDLGPGIQPRQGFTECAAVEASDSWVFPHSDGTRYLIIHSGDSLLADTGDCSFGTTVSTVAASVRVSATVLGDDFYFASTTDGLKSWDSSAVSVASATLTVSMLATHQGCVWAAGKASSPRAIYKSAFGQGNVWELVTDPAVTDPAQFVVGGASDEILTAIYASHRGELIWMKPTSFGSVYGKDRSDFGTRVYSDNVGTAYKDSIRDCDGLLRWLGPSRTIYEWNGSKLENIGKNIKTLLEGIAQGDANARSFTITEQSDYQSGTSYQTSAAISAGDIALSTWTATDTTTADFDAFTSSSNVTVTSDRIYLSTNNTNVYNNDFETILSASCGSGEWLDGWTSVDSGPGVGPCYTSNAYSGSSAHSVQGGTFPGSPITGYYIRILDSAGSVLQTFSNDIGSLSTSYAQFSKLPSATIGRFIKFQLYVTASGGDYTVTSDDFLFSGSTITYWAKMGATAGPYEVFIDLVEGGRSTVYSGSFTSQAFDTALTSAAWMSSGANWTTNGHAVSTWQTESSSDGTTWQSAVAWSTGSAPASDFRRYIRYSLAISTGGTTDGTALPYVDDVTLAARANYGAFVSTNIAIGDSISSWGLFGADTDLDSGSVSYAVYADTDTTMLITSGVPVSGFVSSQTITNNSYPTISTAAYVRLAATMTITSGDYDPTNHSLTLNWAEGNTLPVPSAWFRQRYWLGVAQNNPTNNRVLVFDRNRQWQRYSGIEMETVTPYAGTIFFGNTDGVFQYETGYDDDGAAIAAYYETPTFSPAGPNLYTSFNDFYLTTDRSAETITPTFQVDGVDTDRSLYSVVMNTQSGIQNVRLPFPWDSLNQGKNISFKWSVSGTSFWRLLGSTLDHTPERVAP